MSKPYSYAMRFVAGTQPGSTMMYEVLDTLDHGNEGNHLLLRQHAPWPDSAEGEEMRAGLHKLLDAWIDGVEYK